MATNYFVIVEMPLKWRTVSHRQVAFEILKLSVLDKNLCGTEVVSTRLLQSLLYQFLEYKKRRKNRENFRH